MQIRVKTPTDGGEAEFLTKFYCDYKKYCLNLRKRTLTSELMNIRRYITALLLLFGCIISLSAAAVPNVRSVSAPRRRSGRKHRLLPLRHTIRPSQTKLQ